MTIENAQVNGRLMVILMVIVGLVASVGVILNAASLGKSTQPSISIAQTDNSQSLINDWMEQQPGGEAATTASTTLAAAARAKRDLSGRLLVNKWSRDDCNQGRNKHWTLAVGMDNGIHDYVDEEGMEAGFSRRLARAVCEAAHLDCRLMYDTPTNCWQTPTLQAGSRPSGGQGLLGGWYDACVGWVSTAERRSVFDFSLPYTQPPQSFLFVNNGSSVRGTNLAGNTIALVAGSASDVGCLLTNVGGNQGNALEEAGRFVHVATAKAAVKKLASGEVDAVFGSMVTMRRYLEPHALRVVGDGAVGRGSPCSQGGHGVMTRVDSQFIPLWNEGFRLVQTSGVLSQLCEEASQNRDKYGDISCILE